MKKIENLKVVFGIILLSFAVLVGIIFFLESFGIFNNILRTGSLSMIFQNGISITGTRLAGSSVEVGGGTSNVTIFIGLCGIAGAYLLGSIKS